MASEAANGTAPAETHSSTAADGGHDAAHETYLGLDSYGWVAVAFLIFAGLLWKFGAFKMVGGALDSRAEKVRGDLAEVAELKAEAEALKAKAAAEAVQAAADAKAMLATAEVEAARILQQAKSDAEDAIFQRTRMAEDRIAAEARAAEAELRARASDIVVKAARAVLAERAAKGELDELTDAAIAGLDRR